MPTRDEVRRECAEKGYVVDADEFYDRYEKANWTIGDRPIKSWKGILASANKDEQKRKPPEPKPGNYGIGTPGEFERNAVRNTARLAAMIKDRASVRKGWTT